MRTKRKSYHKFNRHLQSIIEIRKTERLWHFPALAGICIGLCLLAGWYFDRPDFGNISSMGALTILYFTHASLEKRMLHLIICAFGMTFAFMTGLVFSFNPWISALTLAFIAFIAHLLTSYFDIPPPRNFFFIMAAAVATNIPHDIDLIPTRVGLFAMGSMVSVLLAFFYSVFIAKKVVVLPRRSLPKNRYTKTVESVILATALFLALLIGYAVDEHSPYWIPVSALAVLQGKDLTHTSERNIHRILGTFVGIGLTWLILATHPNGLAIVLVIASLQFIVEMLIVRNYLFAAIFITPMTILLAEGAGGMYNDHDAIITARLLDTILGSLIGFATGWILHHNGIISRIEKQFRATRIMLKKR